MASSSERKMRWSPCCCTCVGLKTPAGAALPGVQTPPGRRKHCGLYLRFKAQAALCPQSYSCAVRIQVDMH